MYFKDLKSSEEIKVFFPAPTQAAPASGAGEEGEEDPEAAAMLRRDQLKAEAAR